MTGNDEHIPPRFKSGLTGTVWDCPGGGGPPNFSLDYGYNAWGITSRLDQEPLGLGGKIREVSLVGYPETPRVPVPEGDVVNPSRMIALGDGVSGWGDGFVWVSGHISRERPLVERRMLTPFNSSRHQARVNLEFADGHVELAPLRRLFVETTDEGLSAWNRDNRPHRERLSE